MSLAQAQSVDTPSDSKYVPINRSEEQGSRFNNDREANNKLAYHGKAGDVSSRPKPGRNFNRPQTESAVRFQKSRKKSK